MGEAPLWTADELVLASGGELTGAITKPLNGVSIDTRTPSPGDIFVAIRGESHDAHDFVAKALGAGAGVAIVSRVTEEMKAAGPLLVVANDPLDGLVVLGRAARARPRARFPRGAGRLCTTRPNGALGGGW